MRLWISHAEKRERVLAAISNGARFGLDIINDTGMGAGRVYPILVELEREGVIESNWWRYPPHGRLRRAYRLLSKVSAHG